MLNAHRTRTRKNWIYTPSQDFEPGKTLALGQILEDPFQPASALIARGQIPPASLVSDKGSKGDVDLLFTDKLSSSFRAYCELHDAPVAADVHAQNGHASREKWHMAKLESNTFIPDRAYVEKALGSGDVPTKTQWWKLRRRVFMVTGVRIARGASKTAANLNTSDAGFSAEVDGAQTNVPARIGATVGQTTSGAAVEKNGSISAFIFAYRLHEINYRVWISHRPIIFGHTASVMNGYESNGSGQSGANEDGVDDVEDESGEESEQPEPDSFEIQGLDDDPFAGEESDPRLTE